MNFMERHQVVLYLISMGIGTVIACLGWIGWSEISEMFVPYVLGALLWTNFVLIPLTNLGGSGKSQLRKATMLAVALLTPAVTALLVPLFLPAGGSVALAATIVLLAPCVDYVVVFTRIAGGEYRGLLAATPYLLILQFLTIPLWTSIYTYVGMFDTGLVESFFPLPAESYLSLVPLILPLIAAYTLQRWSHRSLQRQRTYERVSKVSDAAMIPTMCLLLVLMCIAYIPAVLREMHLIPRLAGLYTAYALMVGTATWTLSHLLPGARCAFSGQERISLTFSAVTRNALIIYPIVALCAQRLTQNGHTDAGLMSATVLTQTLTELLIMTTMAGLFRWVYRTQNSR